MRKVQERFWAEDWNTFRAFVKEYDAFDLFERRIHQGNTRAFMEEHKTTELPPGLNVQREYKISVRRAS
jgi:hypothetical protein